MKSLNDFCNEINCCSHTTAGCISTDCSNSESSSKKTSKTDVASAARENFVLKKVYFNKKDDDFFSDENVPDNDHNNYKLKEKLLLS